ncbi:MAG: adenylate/guanylate cyclase domain-containing protein [Gammaproteobacteria bacterium]|nr:adenylate/guanylate cyclase domain-containing protein [Gammaproteobacteria bacterium]MDH3466132.1 adenylate/guanylate cyclase domain-containing protein [Gammaproteobacteria bacterium]
MQASRREVFNWDLSASTERIWTVLADTARFNEAAGFPKHSIQESAQPDGSVQFTAHAHFGPLALRWRDFPQNWVDRRWFRHLRQFDSGPIKTLCVTLRLEPRNGGCRCSYEVEIGTRNALGKLLLQLGLHKFIQRKVERLVRDAEAYCRGQRATPFKFKPMRLVPGASERVQRLTSMIAATPYSHGLADQLASYVTDQPEVDVFTIRPLRLARLWGVSDRHAIEVCLEAVRCGLLGMRWDLLCPRCQVGKSSIASLSQLPKGAHCPSCNIDFHRDFTANVELAFHPSKSVRDVDDGEYCLMGPMTTHHIKLQLTLKPNERLVERADFEPGTYRVRTLEPGQEAEVEWRIPAFPNITLNDNAIAITDSRQPGNIDIHNRRDRELTVIIEELAWRRDALTAQRATALQSFRDLFNSDVLRPGDDVDIDSITIMFTDLKGSTALYDRIGDPKAYVLVREHFEILGRAVREHNGSIVKMIGDAIMAVFTDPADSLSCALAIHDEIDAFNQHSEHDPLVVKIGLHIGRCIAVTLNDKLDYYGSVPNMAARLQNQSEGGDIVLSTEFAADPAIDRQLDRFDICRETVELKGFTGPVPFLRIRGIEDGHRGTGAASDSVLIAP